MWSVVEWQDSDSGIVLSRHRTKEAADRAVEKLVESGSAVKPDLMVVREVSAMRVGTRVWR